MQEHDHKPKHIAKYVEENSTDTESEGVSAASDSSVTKEWQVDSGATSHMTDSKALSQV